MEKAVLVPEALLPRGCTPLIASSRSFIPFLSRKGHVYHHCTGKLSHTRHSPPGPHGTHHRFPLASEECNPVIVVVPMVHPPALP